MPTSDQLSLVRDNQRLGRDGCMCFPDDDADPTCEIVWKEFNSLGDKAVDADRQATRARRVAFSTRNREST